MSANRVLQQSTTTGTGTYTLGTTPATMQSFSAGVGVGNACWYAAAGDTGWEIGKGTVGAGTLARTSILTSSNSNNAVDWPAGTRNIFVLIPIEKNVHVGPDGNIAVSAPIVSTAVIQTTGFIGGGTTPAVALDLASATAGTAITARMTHADTTNTASHAQFLAVVGGAGGGDPLMRWSVTGVSAWSAGIDNSVTGDPWKLSNSSALGTSDVMVVTATAISPGSDDAIDLGTGALRFDDVNATNGTIVTSSRALKRDIRPAPGASLIRRLTGMAFKWRGGARDHFGLIADELKAALDAEGIDAGIYVDPAISEMEGPEGWRPHELLGPIVNTLNHLLDEVDALRGAS